MRWPPGVRLILAMVALLPMVAAGVLAGSRLVAGWTSREQARLVADDAAQLQAVAEARAQMNFLSSPIRIVSVAAGAGRSTTDLDALLHPVVSFKQQLDQATAAIDEFPDFSSPVLRDDVPKLKAVAVAVAAHTIEYAEVDFFLTSMAVDIDNVWYETFDKLQADVSAWQSSGSFGVHASTLLQTYQAFLSGGDLLDAAGFVLRDAGDRRASQTLIQTDAVYRVSTGQFAGHLSPLAQAVWESMRADSAGQQFAATIESALKVATTGEASPWAGDLTGTISALAPGLEFVTDLNRLVVAASQDLHDSALDEASRATGQFATDAALVVMLVAVVVAGVAIAGRMITRPLRRLGAAAEQVHDGDFDLDRLPTTGPREIAATTAAFNEMASTLKAVESRAVALAAEDFSSPELSAALPGRTGHALQATIDSLAATIRDRERQRQLLHEAATHDQLTGLLNRAAVIEYLTNDVARRRKAGETVAVLFMDLDGLKHINDTYGHEVGDSAVTATARAILEATGICDVVGRLGGDEFLVVLCHQHSSDGDDVAERVNSALARHRLPVHGFTEPLRASVGVAIAQCDADTDPITLVRQADAAMYTAKRTARAAKDERTASKP